MVLGWIKRFLGFDKDKTIEIDPSEGKSLDEMIGLADASASFDKTLPEMQSKIDALESRYQEMEEEVIRANEFKEIIRKSVKSKELEDSAREYLSKHHEINVSHATTYSALREMSYIDAVQKYNLKRFVPSKQRAYNTDIISIEEFRKNPNKYYHKLNSTFFEFPIGLNATAVNKYMRSWGVTINDRDGNLSLDFSNIDNQGFTAPAADHFIKEVMNIADLNRTRDHAFSTIIDPLDFIHNYESLQKMASELNGPSEFVKGLIQRGLGLGRMAYLAALEITGKTRIHDPIELLDIKHDTPSPQKTERLGYDDTEEQFLNKLMGSMLEDPKGTTYEEIQTLLPIRSKEIFRRLANERTLEMIASSKSNNKDALADGIENLSVGESVMLAAVFARNVITNYKSLSEQVGDILSGEENNNKMTGTPKQYIGLTLHYLKEYLIPLSPKKFEGWKFGYNEAGTCGSGTIYLKAIKVNPDYSVDVYPLDPLQLAKYGSKGFKTTKDIAKIMDLNKLPVMISREAEDFIAEPVKKTNAIAKK